MRDELPRLPSEAYIKGREDASKKLRDEFAGLAMQALINKEVSESLTSERRKIIAKRSFKIADEMMEARK